MTGSIAGLTGGGVRRRACRTGAAVLTLALLAACSGGSGHGTTVPSAGPGQSGSTAVGPATASVALTGAGGLNGVTAISSISCSQPSLTSLGITVFGSPPQHALTALVVLGNGKVHVRLATGSGPRYRERDFDGTGVTNFDATHGAIIDSALTPAASFAGTPHNHIGAITHITGNVACNGQRPGTSAITFTGATPLGPVTGAVLTPVHVACSSNGALLLGLLHVGAHRLFADVGLSPQRVSVLFVQAKSTVHYSANAAGLVTLHPATVHVTATTKADTSSNTLHLDGSATCGTA